MTCDICGGESGGTYVGVYAVPGAPLSIGWCDECLKHNSAPTDVFENDFIRAKGDVTNLNAWGRSRVTWHDGRYVGFDEFVKTISSDKLTTAWAKWAQQHYPITLETCFKPREAP